MKTLLLILAVFVTLSFTAPQLYAQGLTGRVFYKSSSAMKFSMDSTRMSAEVMDDLQRQLRKQLEREYVLSFNPGESNWKQQESLGSGPATASAGGTSIMINTGSGDRLLYKNIMDQNYLQEEELMGREFLVADSLPAYAWELTDETKKIGDYTCYKARYSRVVEARQFSAGMEEMENVKDTVTTVAWYTPEIPVSHGPAEYWGLPGLILEVQDGRNTLLCEKIVLNPNEAIAIQKPTRGKGISREAYKQLANEKAEEMMKRYNGKPGEGNRFSIRIGN